MTLESNATSSKIKRISSIDFTRGLVMLIMALDHSRDLMHIHSLTQDPTNLATTTPFLFFTRWITHFCAPIFVFLAGTSAFLSSQKGTWAKNSSFLIKRGIWLVVLEFTVVTFGIWADIHFEVFLFQVIAAIGFGFILLGLLMRFPAKTLGIIGIVIILFHQLIRLPEGSISRKIAFPLLESGFIPISKNTSLIMAYPVIPWLGIMLAGFGFGYLFLLSSEKRKNLFWKIGLVVLLLFIFLRETNFYGDPSPWTVQKNSLFTFLSFLNVSKYPPSALYSLLTLGFMFMILSFAEGIKNRFFSIVEVYGKVPLFYYLIHWYIIHAVTFFMLFMQGFKVSDFKFGFNFGRPAAQNGVELWVLYLIWAGIVIGLYPLCKWYGRYKEKHREKWWLRYL